LIVGSHTDQKSGGPAGSVWLR